MSRPHPSHADIIPLYEAEGAAWASQRGVEPGAERVWLDRFISRLQPGAVVLDLGCGSGRPIAARLLDAGFKVCGVDAAATMIGLCRKDLPAGEWVRTDMRGLDLGRRFGGIIAWDSFFHLAPDAQRTMFSVFARHAAPGAPLLFSSGPRAGEALGSLEGCVLYHASLGPDEYRAFLVGHGFEELAHAAEDPEAGGHTAWLARASTLPHPRPGC